MVVCERKIVTAAATLHTVNGTKESRWGICLASASLYPAIVEEKAYVLV